MEDWMTLLAGETRVAVIEGGGLELRLLSALELMQCQVKAREMVWADSQLALCANGCLLAVALERDGKPVFEDGLEVLEKLSLEQVHAYCQQWGEFTRTQNPSALDSHERVVALKKA